MTITITYIAIFTSIVLFFSYQSFNIYTIYKKYKLENFSSVAYTANTLKKYILNYHPDFKGIKKVVMLGYKPSIFSDYEPLKDLTNDLLDKNIDVTHFFHEVDIGIGVYDNLFNKKNTKVKILEIKNNKDTKFYLDKTKTEHFVLFYLDNEKFDLWLEGNHPVDEQQSYDCQYIANIDKNDNRLNSVQKFITKMNNNTTQKYPEVA
jgi:hypothetical protein